MASALAHPQPSEAVTRLDDIGNGQVRLTIREEVPWTVALKILERLREVDLDDGSAECRFPGASSEAGNATPRP